MNTKPSPGYLPDEYDARGQLRLPFLFWLILLLQARTWLLLVMAGASRQQGNDLLAATLAGLAQRAGAVAAGESALAGNAVCAGRSAHLTAAIAADAL